VRIPLDYYRIIGLPLQATAEQLEQAYQDKLRQTPHLEYTPTTLAARKELLDLAYQVLSDPEQRSEYDANYLLTTYEMEGEESIALPPIQSEEEAVAMTSQMPKLEVETPQQFLGALLILYELGEYQRVRHLAEWVLSNSIERETHRAVTSEANLPRIEDLSPPMQGDLVLTLALACWELGRELWRQEQYEGAAEAVSRGEELLRTWDLFSHLRLEMVAELNKLSPYRIFELLSQRAINQDSVPKGIALLEEMFDKRGGIDGDIPDDSGLDIDEFLHFVQQIRDYLTAPEQEELFAKEAQRPSGVAKYLAACAGIARGFAYLEPYYILKGQQFLSQLEQEYQQKNNCADVYLEESICALLLGNPDQALKMIDKSQETDAIAEIQAYADQAEETPDLLLGLYHYAQQWLETVLFPKFLDLTEQTANLKDYFASESVQETLESFQTEEGLDPSTASLPEMETASLASSTALEERYSDSEDSSRSYRRRPHRQLRLSSKRSRWVAVVAMMAVGLGAIALLGLGLYRGATALWATLFNQNSNSSQMQGQPLALDLDRPIFPIPSADSEESQKLTRDRAERLVRSWLSSKALALGPEHQIQALDTILTDPLLSQWQSRAETFANQNVYQQFRHSVSIESISSETPNQGQIVAQVREVAKYYRNGRQSPNYSYDSTLKVRYNVIRENETWQIKGIELIN